MQGSSEIGRSTLHLYLAVRTIRGLLFRRVRQQVRKVFQDASLLLGVALLEFLGIETLLTGRRFRVADAVKLFEQLDYLKTLLKEHESKAGNR